MSCMAATEVRKNAMAISGYAGEGETAKGGAGTLLNLYAIADVYC
jgi:hypothetical protein